MPATQPAPTCIHPLPSIQGGQRGKRMRCPRKTPFGVGQDSLGCEWASSWRGWMGVPPRPPRGSDLLTFILTLA